MLFKGLTPDKSIIPSLQRGDVENLEVTLPPYEEQQVISQVLQTVQETIKARQWELELERECKAAITQYMFTYGPISLDSLTTIPLRKTEIGLMPEHWVLVRLEEIIKSGPKNGVYKHQSLYGHGTPIVRINDFDNDGDIIVGSSNRVDLLPNEIEEYGLNQNDILINRVNSLSHLGKVALIGVLAEAHVFESNMMRFNVNKDIAEPEYIFRYLASPIVREQIKGIARRAVAQSSINQNDVKSIVVPLPPLSEQRAIMNTLMACNEKICALEGEQAILEELFNTLLDELLTGRLSTIPLIEKETTQ